MMFGSASSFRGGPVVPPASPTSPSSIAGRPRGRDLLQRLVPLPLVRTVASPLDVRGLDWLRDIDGPAVFAPNHASHLDAPLVVAALPPALRRSLAIAAAEDYFYRCHALGATLSLLLGTFPFNRLGNPTRSLDVAEAALRGGTSILIFPEGTRSSDGTVGTFQRGAARLAARTGVPLVPVWIEGSRQSWPRERRLPRRGPATITFGEPMYPQPGADLRRASTRLRDRVLELRPMSQPELLRPLPGDPATHNEAVNR